jgi:hypothetical protein
MADPNPFDQFDEQSPTASATAEANPFDQFDAPPPAVSSAQKTAPMDPTEGMSTGDKFVAGAGKSFVDTGRGLYQLGASIGHAAGMVSDEKMKQIQSDADEAKKYDAPLMHTTAGAAGDIGGGIAQIAALPELLPAKAAAVPLLADAASGAAFSGSQPTSTGESRLENTAEGAAGGAAGSLVGKGLGFIAQPLKNSLSEAGQHAINILKQSGIPLDLAQQTGNRIAQTMKNVIADNPLIGHSVFPEEQGKAFNRAVLKKMGVNDPSVTVADGDTMQAGRTAITDTMNDVAKRNPIKYDDGLEIDLSGIEKDASGQLSPNDLGPVKAHLNNIVQAAASNDGSIPGAVYQKMRSQLGALSKDPKYAPVVGDIQEALDDAFQRSTSTEDQKALSTARQHYRAMKQIEGAINPDTGDISPGKLLGQINTKANRNQSLYGQGDQSLVELAKAGKQVLAPTNPNSGTARRLAGMAGVGALAGGADEALHGNPGEALKVGAAAAALPYLGRKLLENPTLVKAATRWNNSSALKGATDVARKGLAAAVPATINANDEGATIARATGGKVDHEALVQRLINRWKAAKKATDATTKPLLGVSDNSIAKALEIAGNAL